MVAMAWATSARSSPGNPASAADARSGRRWARTSAIVAGSSSSSTDNSCPGSASSRNSKGRPAMVDASLSMTPAAFSLPKEAASRPAAKSRPPWAACLPRTASPWNSSTTASATSGWTLRIFTISAAIDSASASERWDMTAAAADWENCMSRAAAFCAPVSVASAIRRPPDHP